MAIFSADRALAMLHSWSTTYLVVGSKMFAPLRSAHPDRYVRIPLLIFLLSLLLGVLIAKTVNISDEGVVDADSFLFYVPYIGLFMVGHFWHFGRQDFGVLSLYRTRAGQTQPLDRRVDSVFAQVMMYVIQPVMYFTAFTRAPFTVLFQWITSAGEILKPLATLCVVLACVMTLGVVVFELRKPRRSLGKLLYYLVMLFHPLFLYSANAEAFVYWHFAYLWSHWIIAIVLAARVHTGFLRKSGASPRQSLVRHLVVVGGIAGAVYLAFTPFAGLSILRGDFIDVREILRLLNPDQYLIIGIYFGFGLGEQLVHYYCDRCLFRFKNPDVRAVVAPFLR